jgi:hypothetical protein
MRLRLAILACLALVTAACSLIFGEPEQCATNEECTNRGTAFAGATCVEHRCVVPAPTPGEGGTPIIKTNAECSADLGAPARWVAGQNGSAGACTLLRSDDCQVILSGGVADPWNDPEPVYVGAYAAYDFPTDAVASMSYDLLIYNLAITEFAEATKGIKRKDGSAHPIVLVACNSYATSKFSTLSDADKAARREASLRHLVLDVGVRVVLTQSDVSAIRDNLTLVSDMVTKGETSNHVLFINPYVTHDVLSSFDSGDLLWSMLGPPSNFATLYQAAVPRIESYIRTKNAIPAQQALKWLVVRDEVTDFQKLYDATFASASIKPTLVSVIPESNLDDLTAQIAAAQPDVIVSMTDKYAGAVDFVSAKKTGIGRSIENKWPVMAKRPFHLLNYLDFVASTSKLAAFITSDDLRRRVIGVNYARAADTTVYQTRFADVFKARFGTQVSPQMLATVLDYENVFDAAYFALYSIAARGLPALDGEDYAAAMRQLVDTTKTNAFSVGKADIMNVTALLGQSNPRLALQGALGPPNFNVMTGTPTSEGSLWCCGAAGDGGCVKAPDVMRLGDAGADGARPLVGSVPCYAGF